MRATRVRPGDGEFDPASILQPPLTRAPFFKTANLSYDARRMRRGRLMFNRFSMVVLLAGIFFGAAVVAQQPNPTPSPKRGTREYTEASFDRYKQAEADYAALSAKQDATLPDLEAAYQKMLTSLSSAYAAMEVEADGYDDVKKAKSARDTAESTYKRLKGRDPYSAEKEAERDLRIKNTDYHNKALAHYEQIQSAIGMRLPSSAKYSARHEELLDAKRKAEEEARKKAEAEKKAQEEKKSGSSQAPQCSRGSGLGGAMENVACQEQHSGSTH